MNTRVQVFVWVWLSALVGIYLGVELVGCMVTRFSVRRSCSLGPPPPLRLCSKCNSGQSCPCDQGFYLTAGHFQVSSSA